MKCPKCGSTNISVERRPDGFSRCHKCGNSWQHERKTPELTTAEKLMWLAKNSREVKLKDNDSGVIFISVINRERLIFDILEPTVEQSINVAYEWAKQRTVDTNKTI